MLLELIGFFGIIITLMIIVAELGKNYAGGVIAGVLIIILGCYIFLDGIQIQTGTITTIAGTQDGTNVLAGEGSEDLDGNATSSSTKILYNESGTFSLEKDEIETTEYVYENIPAMPYIGFDELMGVVLVLTGLYTIFVYNFK